MLIKNIKEHFFLVRKAAKVLIIFAILTFTVDL